MHSPKFFTVILLFVCFAIQAQPVTTNNKSESWPTYGNDAGGNRYSPLTQVNSKNVKNLRPAWTFRTGELETYAGTNALSKAAFEATPVMVGNTLYFSTPTSRVFAVDAVTGKQRWVYDATINLKNHFSEVTSRGVSVWPAQVKGKPAKAVERIFVATIDGRLIALHAATGKIITTFGDSGTVDLKVNLGQDISVTSPPAIMRNLVITGSSLGDNYSRFYPRGTVRAFDAITGKLVWGWDPIPRDSTDPGWETWKGPNSHSTTAANAWSVISVDHDRDMVFIPTSSPCVDYYGGERLGSNLYGNSIVALQASTGKMLWHFQVVHHDLWDYDIPAQPVLIDLKRNNKSIPAVVVGTKMGHIFVLDRITGKPLLPVEERNVPASTIIGEEAFPTQPFPVKPAPLGLQSVSVNDAWGLTEELKKKAAERIALYTNKGIFTPPSLKGSLITPGNVGGIHWGGMCYDPVKQQLITNINWLAAIIRLIPRDSMANEPKDEEQLIRAEIGPQHGTPYLMKRDYLFSGDQEGLKMQTKPPWGTLNAIHLASGESKWQVPLGYMLDPVKYPKAKEWGSLNLGGAIVTAGNLVFVAATRDGYFRAFNTNTGELLWEYLLPAGGQATPMTYMVNGKQYIVIAAGGHGKFLTKMGDFVVAFALP
jgi:quinoprotein glucose dehydrogenase